MNGPSASLRRRLSWPRALIPLGLGIVVALVSFYVRAIEMRADDQRMHFQASNVASVLSARLADHVASRLDAAKLFRPVRTIDGRLDFATFREDAERMHALFDDIQAVNYVDAEGVIRIVTPVEGNEGALGIDVRRLDLPSRALARAEATGSLQITPPIELAQGGRGFVGYRPMVGTEGLLGFLNIVFRADALIAPLLTDHIVRTFDIRILDDEALVYASSVAGPRPDDAEVTMIDIAQRTWRIEIAPIQGPATATFFESAIIPFGIGGALVVAMLGHLVVSRQASLENSEAMFIDFASASSDWYWETDSENRLTWLSDGFERALGARREDFLGRDRSRLTADDGTGAAPAGRALDLSARQPFRDFVYPVLIDGHRKWIRTSGVPVFDRDDRFLGYRGTASNVTDEIETRDEAERAQWLLQTAVENLDEHFSVWDADDRLVIANTQFRSFFAAELAELPANTAYEGLLRKMIEKGRLPDAAGNEAEAVRQRMARRRNHEGETEHTFADGRVFRVREVRLANGGMVVTAVEVTAEKRSESALRASEERYELASRQVSIWDWNLPEDRLYISPQFAMRLGYSQEEFAEITRRSVAEIIHPADAESYRAALARHIREPGAAFSHEHRFRTKSGDYRWFLARGQAVTDADGTVIRSTGILTDITERVALEDRLQQAQKMEAIGQLTGGLAHDFNNLLAVVQGHAEALVELDGPAQTRAAAILRAARRGSDLTQRLLAFSRRQPLRPRAIDCVDLTAGLLELLQRTLGEKTAIAMDMPQGLWPAMADPGQVESALLNLVINARDAMPDGGEVRITGHNATVADGKDDEGGSLRPGRYVVLSVSDQGHGMSDEVRRHAFEPFFTTKGVGKGSGLGLSMVYGFAQQSGGIATIDSAPGRGTTVNLYLPRALGGAPRADARDDETLPRGNGQTILVVEDDDEVRTLVQEMLTDLGYRTLVAGDVAGARALLAEATDIAMVLTDVVLPGGPGGADFAADLAASRPALKLVFMSGYPAEANPDGETWDLGRPILVKPFRKAQLAKAVAEVLAGDGPATG